MIRRTTNAFLLISPQGRIAGASDTAAQALGCDSGLALTRTDPSLLATRYTPETPEGSDERVSAAGWLDGARSERILRFRDPLDGWDRWALLRALPDPLGQTPGGRLCLVQDITAFRRREQAARLLDEATLRLTRAHAPDRVYQHAAVAAIPVLGDESVVMSLRPDRTFVPRAWYVPGPNAAARVQALVVAVAPTLADVERTGRAVLLGPSAGGGSDHGRSILIAPVRDARETVALLVLAMAPDTGRGHHPGDRRVAEQLGERVGRALADARLQESERRRLLAAEEREAFLTDLGSELRDQLPELLSACERLERALPESERRVVRRIREQSRRLNDTVDRLLTRN